MGEGKKVFHLDFKVNLRIWKKIIVYTENLVCFRKTKLKKELVQVVWVLSFIQKVLCFVHFCSNLHNCHLSLIMCEYCWMLHDLQVKQDGFFPADLLFLASTNPDGVCYVEVLILFYLISSLLYQMLYLEKRVLLLCWCNSTVSPFLHASYLQTANLDGETNLKIRKALERTWDFLTPEKASEFKG